MWRGPTRSALVAVSVLAMAAMVFAIYLANKQGVSRPLSKMKLEPANLRAPLIEADQASVSRSTPQVEQACVPEPPLSPAKIENLRGPALLQAFRAEPESLGSASIGTPTRGALWGAAELKSNEAITRVGNYPYGTALVIEAIERAVRQVQRCHPGSPPLSVGDLSRKTGGYLSPHRSHQAGLDVDIGYYYLTGPAWFVPATRANLDVARTWTMIASLVDTKSVAMIFVDRSIQVLLSEHAKNIGQPEADLLFESPLRKDAVIRHTWGHATHFHVRFYDPAATALGSRLAAAVPKAELLRTIQASPQPRLAAGRQRVPNPRSPWRPKASVAGPTHKSR